MKKSPEFHRSRTGRCAAVLFFAAALLVSPILRADTVMIHIFNTDFSTNPSGQPVVDPTIRVGDTVVWVWMNGTHSTTSAAGQTESWDSGIQPTGSSSGFSHTFTQPGVYGYFCRVHGFDAGGGRGGGMSGTITVHAQPASQLTNISTRLRVETGANIGIGGFIIKGGSKKVLVRALGPSLASFGVTGVLMDPTITLVDVGGNPLGQNDSWKSTQQTEIEATGLAPGDDHECGIITTLPAGNYTVLLSGVGSTSGVGIVEVFDLDTTMPGRLGNVSTRGQVQIDDKVMIGGFIIGGTDPLKVIVRGKGPALTAAGVPGALQNPFIQLFSGPTVLAQDDNWRDTQQAEINASLLPPTDDRESAIVATLPPGPYTVVVRGVAQTAGVGLVEVFELP
jgi:plastocyanin